MGRWRRGKWERESPVSPQPPRVLRISFYTFWLSWLNDFSPLSWEPGTGYHLYKSVPFTEKQPRRPETGIKEGFEAMEHEFSFAVFYPENRTTFSDVPLLPEIFRCEHPKSRVPFTFRADFPENFCKRWLLTIYKYFRPPRSLIPHPHPRPPFSGKKVIFTEPLSF